MRLPHLPPADVSLVEHGYWPEYNTKIRKTHSCTATHTPAHTQDTRLRGMCVTWWTMGSVKFFYMGLTENRATNSCSSLSLNLLVYHLLLLVKCNRALLSNNDTKKDYFIVICGPNEDDDWSKKLTFKWSLIKDCLLSVDVDRWWGTATKPLHLFHLC